MLLPLKLLILYLCVHKETIMEKLSLDQVTSQVAWYFPPEQYKELEKTKVIGRSFRSVSAPSVFTGGERSRYYVADSSANCLIVCVYCVSASLLID